MAEGMTARCSAPGCDQPADQAWHDRQFCTPCADAERERVQIRIRGLKDELKAARKTR